MIRIENRFQLKQVRAECQAETKQVKVPGADLRRHGLSGRRLRQAL